MNSCPPSADSTSGGEGGGGGRCPPYERGVLSAFGRFNERGGGGGGGGGVTIKSDD